MSLIRNIHQLRNTASCGTPGNIFPTDNAAGECGDNAVTGWTETGSDLTSVLVDGSYVLNFLQVNTSQDRGEYSITVDNSSTYDITYDVRYIVNNNSEAQVSAWTGVATSPQRLFGTSGWNTYTESVTTNSTTMLMRFYVVRGTTSSGNEIQVRNLSVVKTS